MRITGEVKYEYKNAPIPGGGYVTGIMYHPKKKDVLYARTDIGGTYRFDFEKNRWKSLIEHVTGEHLEETYPIALGLDESHPERLYIASGIWKKGVGVLSVSEDYGETFTYEMIPTTVHGNQSGRGVGYRLVVDKNDSNVLYFASQVGGLLKTSDRGKSWEKLPVPEDYTTFVWVSQDSQTLVVGTAGYITRVDDSLRGHSLYVSYDGGVSFEKLMQPENVIVEDSKMNGLVASRYDYDGTYLYVTMNSTGRWNYIVDLGYSCDTGDVIGGKVLRYEFRDGRITGYTDITPGEDGVRTTEYLNYGFGGVCSCLRKPGLLVCSSLCKEKMGAECVYISEDYGESWRVSLNGLEKGGIYFRTSYMKPEYNGNHCLLHWLSDIKMDPFNPNKVWFNSGTGVFTSDALLSENPAYHDFCDGIEETVHLNVYAPLKGEVKLLDIVGDLGGFAFRDLDTPCTNSFADAEGNRYITCINADLSDENDKLAMITARGNWKGKTKGGLIRTTDGYESYERIPMPFGISERLDKYLHWIEEPNVNPGWVAMSPSGENIVWSVADIIRLPKDLVIYSKDAGKSFAQVAIYDKEGRQTTEGYFKAYSDRMENDLFYGFDEKGKVYISKDGGASFHEKEVPGFPAADFGMIDTANKTEARGEAGKSGVFYMALGEHGLWRFAYNKEDDSIVIKKLSQEGDVIHRAGLGLGREGGDYLTESKALYVVGSIDGIYGFYRTLDEGETYVRINTKEQMYGEINSCDGDKRVFGRFFIATGSRGVLYGEEVK
ncbi:MAG: endoglucanase [Lachnospiraceae bacterium]|nr:endoglucanase [Lachnospiraceae bacterium]